MCAGNCGRDDCDTSCVGGVGVGGGEHDSVGATWSGISKENRLFHDSLLIPCVLFRGCSLLRPGTLTSLCSEPRSEPQVHNAYLYSITIILSFRSLWLIPRPNQVKKIPLSTTSLARCFYRTYFIQRLRFPLPPPTHLHCPPYDLPNPGPSPFRPSANPSASYRPTAPECNQRPAQQGCTVLEQSAATLRREGI